MQLSRVNRTKALAVGGAIGLTGIVMVLCLTLQSRAVEAASIVSEVADFLGADVARDMSIEWLPDDPSAGGRYVWGLVTWPQASEADGTLAKAKVRFRFDTQQGRVDIAVRERPAPQGAQRMFPTDAGKKALEFAKSRYPVSWPEGMKLKSEESSMTPDGESVRHFVWTQTLEGGYTGNFVQLGVSEVDGQVMDWMARWNPPPAEFPQVKVPAEQALAETRRLLEANLNERGYPYELQLKEPGLLWRDSSGEPVPVWAIAYVETVTMPGGRQVQGAAVIEVNASTGEVLDRRR